MIRLRHAVLALLLLLLPLGAHAAELADIVQQLGSDSFDAKIAAVQALGGLGDPRAVNILNALHDERLYTTTDDNKVVIADPNGEDFDILDPLTDAKIDTVASDKIDRILVNNRLRNEIDAALAGLNLFSAHREDRLSAAEDAMKHPTRERVPALEKALAAEKDGGVRAALGLALAAANLTSTDKQKQLAAISALADASDPDIFNTLSEARNAPNLDPDVRHALDTALSAISRRIGMFRAAATLFEGLSLGSILLLAAIGLAITFGLMGVINMAHGEMIMLGAYCDLRRRRSCSAPACRRPGSTSISSSPCPVAFLVAGGRRA